MKSGVNISIDSNVIFKGKVIIGDNVTIESNVIIKNTKIENNVTIKSMSIVENACIKKYTSIGPFVRIRPNSIIGSYNKIGNFTEIKNTIFGYKNKVNHMSYLGDSYFKKYINIGAGLTICNYDGVNKYITKIDDNCFIGAKNALVSPINIKKKTRTGASSIIWKDIVNGNIIINKKYICNIKKEL